MGIVGAYVVGVGQIELCSPMDGLTECECDVSSDVRSSVRYIIYIG